jgi:2-iminobutanoate/2-iminopropanoate deaminase
MCSDSTRVKVLTLTNAIVVPYAIQAGDTLYLSGLVSRNGKDNSQVPGDVATQVKTIMDNAGQILEAAGMSHGDLVTGRVALRDMKQFAPMNDVYRS